MNKKKYIGLAAAVLAIGLIFYLSGGVGDEAAKNSTAGGDSTALSAPNTPPSGTTATKTQASSGPVIKNGVYIISYENTGFKPTSLEIKRGTAVRFVNNSTKAMRVGSVESASSPAYQYLTQPKSVGRGAMYELNFNDAGTYKYVNLNNSYDQGTIVIK